MTDEQPVKLEELSPVTKKLLTAYVKRSVASQGGDAIDEQSLIDQILAGGRDTVQDAVEAQRRFEDVTRMENSNNKIPKELIRQENRLKPSDIDNSRHNNKYHSR